jgi:cytochrome c oxidase assembly factor CtaG
MVLVGVMYGLRNRAVRTPRWRQGCFYGGLALMALTLSSPLAPMSEDLFWAHMLEHLLIADLGALLIVLGLTGPVLAPLLRALPFLRVFGHPVVALLAWTANFYVWHLPALYQGAVSDDTVHALQHVLFVNFGIAMWMALLGPLPKPAWFGNGAKLGYIVAVRLIQSVLANALFWSSGVLYPQYARGQAEWGITAANDQSAAGAIMMIEGSIITLVLFGWLFLKAARESDERQELAELAQRLGVELAPERIARAVSAGRGDALRERIQFQASEARSSQ